jgi:hypothetical protein
MSEIGNTGLLKSADFIPSSPASVVSSSVGKNSTIAMSQLFDELSLAENELRKQTNGNLNNPGKAKALAERLQIINQDVQSRMKVLANARSAQYKQVISILDISSNSVQKSLSGLMGNGAMA